MPEQPISVTNLDGVFLFLNTDGDVVAKIGEETMRDTIQYVQRMHRHCGEPTLVQFFRQPGGDDYVLEVGFGYCGMSIGVSDRERFLGVPVWDILETLI